MAIFINPMRYLLSVLALVGCDSLSASAPPTTADVSYKVVLEKRYEGGSDQYLDEPKRAYDLCAQTWAAMAESTWAPVKPAPLKPFAAARPDSMKYHETYISDGRRHYYRFDGVGVEISAMRPDTGCVTSLVATSEIKIVDGPKSQAITIDKDGNVQGEPPEEMPEDEWKMVLVDRQRKTASKNAYTERKSVNGIPVRCISGGGAEARTNAELCIYDDVNGRMPITESGKPLHVYVRAPGFGVVRTQVTEPRSVEVGLRVDAAAFNWIEVKK